MDLKDINRSTSTFWSLGNNPTQKVNNLSAFYVVEHLKLLYLLSDKVLAAGSFYFESEITRDVTRKLQKLFEEGEILYFIDEDLENFEEHGELKVRKSPKSFEAYKDKKVVIEVAKQLDILAPPLRRPPSSISDKIVELWIKELQSESQDCLGGILFTIIKEKDKRSEIIISLSKFAKERKKDFVWEYLHPFLKKLKLNKQFQNIARRKLSQLYSISTAEILGVSLDRNNLSFRKYLAENTKYDTTLFYECMKILGISDAIQNLNTFDLIKLKSSCEFIFFREFYFSLIDSSLYNLGLTKKILPLLVESERTMVSGKINVNDFLKSFTKLCKSFKIYSRSYKNPLEIILNRYEAFNKATVFPFIELLNGTVNNKRVEKYYSNLITNGSEFYIENHLRIDRIITNKFQIPKTDAPQRFGEMTNIIIKWFNNFKRSEYPLVLSILQNVKYYSELDINELLDNMSNELKKLFNNDFSSVNIFGLSNYAGDSGVQFLYRLRQRLGISEDHFPINYSNLSENISSLVFIDDIIGSGNQAIKFYKEKLINIKKDNYYFSIIAFENGMNNIKKESCFKDVYSTVVLSDSDKAFSENSELFPEKVLRDKIKVLSEDYGKKLYPKGALGYDDSQALIVFSHNTPNNTLPIIWASVNNEKEIGIPWNPLFDRKKVIVKK